MSNPVDMFIVNNISSIQFKSKPTIYNILCIPSLPESAISMSILLTCLYSIIYLQFNWKSLCDTRKSKPIIHFILYIPLLPESGIHHFSQVWHRLAFIIFFVSFKDLKARNKAIQLRCSYLSRLKQISAQNLYLMWPMHGR